MVILKLFNYLSHCNTIQIIIYTFVSNIDYMEEEAKFTHGGKRAGAGRKPSPRSKVQIGLKLDADLNDVFESEIFEGNRGQYINVAIREKMKADGYIREVELLESVTVNGSEYIRQKGNNRSSCAQCDLKSECWDLWHYATPCYGGFYKRKK